MTESLTHRHLLEEAPAVSDEHVATEVAHPALTFEQIFEREVAWVVRTLRRLGVGSAEEEDVAQQVFLAVLGKMADRDPRQPVRPWLFAFALRAAANHRRLARHRREVPDTGRDEPPARAASSPEEEVARQQDRALLLEALAELDMDRRAVIIMHDLDEMSAPVIAEALGIPLNTVYSRIRLGRADLEHAVRRLSRRSR